MPIKDVIYQAVINKRANSYRLVATQERLECWRAKELVGFVIDNELHAINPKTGYSEIIGSVNHRSEIAGKLAAYCSKSG